MIQLEICHWSYCTWN